MNVATLLKEKRIERKKLHNENDRLIVAAAKSGRSLTRAEMQEFDRRDQQIAGTRDMAGLDQEIERLEKQQDRELNLGAVRNDSRRAGREDFGGYRNAEDRSVDPHTRQLEREATRLWMGFGGDYLTPEHRAIVNFGPLNLSDIPTEYRALSATTGSAGAYTIPGGFQYELDVALKMYGGIIDAGTFVDTDSGQSLPWPTLNDTSNSGEIIGENTTVTSSQDPTFGATTLNAYMFDSGIIKAPIAFVQDSAFLAEEFLNEALQVRLGRKLNNKCTVGSGTGEPSGVVGAATLGRTATNAGSITYADILALEHSVDPAYRNKRNPKVGFMLSDTTLQAVEGILDGNGRPLFMAGGVTNGIDQPSPDRLRGYPIWINQDMAAIGTGNTSMLFGDFSKYKIRRVRNVQLIRFAERFMDTLQLGFLAYLRADGNIIDSGTRPIRKLVHP